MKYSKSVKCGLFIVIYFSVVGVQEAFTDRYIG